jgi:hypothetical protein
MSADQPTSTGSKFPDSLVTDADLSRPASRAEEIGTFHSSATISDTSTPSNSSADDWMEEILLAGVKVSVKSIPSPDPVRAKLLVEPPMPTWATETPTSELVDELEEMEKTVANFDHTPANTVETPVESCSPSSNVEMSHPLIEMEEVPGDHDRLVDNVFHGLDEKLEEESESEIIDFNESEFSETATVSPDVTELDTDDAMMGAKASVTDETTMDADEVSVPAGFAPELSESDELNDLVAAEIALALKQVEEEAAVEQANQADNVSSVPTSESELDASEGTDGGASDNDDGAPAADQNESLSQEAISSLLAKFDDEDDLPTGANTPKEPTPKVTCPAGTPQPKINLAALKKKGDDAPALAARLFGEGGEPARTTEGEGEFQKNEQVGQDEKSKDRPLPVILIGLDGVTDRLRRIHPMIPAAVGILGGILAVNGVLTAVLASLGWI